MPRVGFFGKLPAKGDFLTRALPPDVLSVWEKWLETSMAGAKQQLGPRWGPTYERAPVWRFWIGARLTGHALTGVWAPSVDRVGRQFPLTFVYTGAPAAMPAAPLAGEGNTPWYTALDRAAMEARHPRFDGDLDGLLDRLPLPNGPRQAVAEDARAAFFAYGEAGLEQLIEDVRHHDHQLVANSRSYWWTAGNDFTGPAMVALNGMPDARGFAALLQGFGPPVRARPAAPPVEPAGWDAAPAPAPPPPKEKAGDMGWAATIPPTDIPENLRPQAETPPPEPQDDPSPFDADGHVATPAPMGAEDDPWAAALASTPDVPDVEEAPLPEEMEVPTPETSPVSDPWKIDETEDMREASDADETAEEADALPAETAGAPIDEDPPEPEDTGEVKVSSPDAEAVEEDPADVPAQEDSDETEALEEDTAAQDAAPPVPDLPAEEEDSPFGRPEDAPAAGSKPLRGLFGRRPR